MPRVVRIPVTAAGRIVLDSGAISKIASGDPVARALWRKLTDLGWVTSVPAVTLAETLTGRADRDAAVNLLLRQIGETIACTDEVARRAGALRFAVRRLKRVPSGIDAIVAAEAQERTPSIVLTTDPGDLSALLAHTPRASVVST